MSLPNIIMQLDSIPLDAKEPKTYVVKNTRISADGTEKEYTTKKKYNYVRKTVKKKPPGRKPLTKEQKIENLKKKINLIENTP